MSDLEIGDRIERQHGPFLSTWEVIAIIKPGAVLAYVGDVRFVGYNDVQYAPGGNQLTEAPEQDFVGRAHWHSVKRVPAP